MKKHHLYLLAITAICFSACGPVYIVHQDPVPAPPAAAPQADPDDVTYQNFYDQLSPYGQWIQDPNYGYVWLPDVGADFKPYSTNGHWVYTDEGWAWDSGYPWGWAAFHYGRWYFQDGYGWMWVPGTEWAPAWVSWRDSDEYYGWAPMAPNVSYDAAYGGGYTPPLYYWNFVPHRYISSPQVNNYYVRETNNVTIINQTTIIRNTTVVNGNSPRGHYGFGPDPNTVGRFSGNPVRPLAIRESHAPGAHVDNGNFTVYRPRVNGSAPDNHSGNAGRPFAPSRAQTLNNARPVNRTVYGNNNPVNNNPVNNNTGGNNGRPNNGSFPNNSGNAGNNNNNNNNNNGGRDDRNNGRNNNNGNNGRDNNPGRTNTGFPNTPSQPVTQPATPPAQNNTPSRPYNQPVPPGNQPNTRFGRPFQPNSQPNQPNQQPATNQPATSQPTNQAPSQPANQPNQQPANQPIRNHLPVQQPIQQPANQPNQQTAQPRQVFGRPPQQQFNRPVTQPPANQNPPKPVVAPPKPAPAPPPPKKDDANHPGRPS